jgi:MoxR-like ATPase
MLRNGGVLIAEELNAGRPEMLARFHTLLDSRIFVLTEHLGETIRASPDFVFVATMNPRDGGRPLTTRMRERFRCTVVFDYDLRAEAKLCPDARLLAVFEKLRGDERIRTPVSTRLIVDLLANVKLYGANVALALLANHFTLSERPIVASAFGLDGTEGTPFEPEDPPTEDVRERAGRIVRSVGERGRPA